MCLLLSRIQTEIPSYFTINKSSVMNIAKAIAKKNAGSGSNVDTVDIGDGSERVNEKLNDATEDSELDVEHESGNLIVSIY